MSAVFLKIVNMSITAGWIVLAIMLLRVLLMKAPKWIRMVLWGIVALRLICPVSVESIFSLIPSAETLPSDLTSGPSFNIDSGVPLLNSNVNEYLDSHYFEGVTVPANNAKIIVSVFSVLWIVGIVVMLAYALLSVARVRKQVCEAVWLKDNVWVCDQIVTPFILGIIRPRIYLPSSMNEQDTGYVLRHENAHLKRRDHLWKPLGFLLLAVHWFNPILWMGYVLLCRDIELACDEKVLKELGNERKKPYAEALVNCSVLRKLIAACPLAFGENSVKQRVKSVLNYRKPEFWIVIVAVLVCVAAGVCLLTNPKEEQKIDKILSADAETLTFFYDGGDSLKTAALTLVPGTKGCNFSFSPLSSYLHVGDYEEDDKYIVTKSDDGGTIYTFEKRDADLIFVAEKSSPVANYKYADSGEPEASLPDGAVFRLGGTRDSELREYDDWGLAMEVSHTSGTEYEVRFYHKSDVATVDGELSTGAAYELKILHYDEPMEIGDYKRDVLHQAYVDDEERAWIAIGYTICRDDVTTLPHQLTLYGELPEGEYILYKEVLLTTEKGELLTKTYSARFTKN